MASTGVNLKAPESIAPMSRSSSSAIMSKLAALKTPLSILMVVTANIWILTSSLTAASCAIAPMLGSLPIHGCYATKEKLMGCIVVEK